MVKPIHDSLYPLYFGLTLLTLTSISIFILLAWSIQCKVIFLYLIWVVSFVIQPLLSISSLMHSWLILQFLIKANPLSNSSCSCKASHYWDQSKIINSCVMFLELCCFHDLPTQQYTILALIETLCGILSSLSSCWTYIHLSFHNLQVYAINSISCLTLSKLVRLLMVLSFNSPKLTKWLDALTVRPEAGRAWAIQQVCGPVSHL
jgi:hypothetical protein